MEMMREQEVMPLFLLCISLRSAVLLFEYLRATESLKPPGRQMSLQPDWLLAGEVLTRKLIRRKTT